MAKDKLSKLVSSTNIAETLSRDELVKIGQRVLLEYQLDKTSRNEWEEQSKRGLKLAKQVIENKSYPWPKAANVKYPLIAGAAVQFAARAYPEIIKGNQIVKAKVFGEDPKGMKQTRADRVGQHMSWQLLEQMSEWEPEMDKLLHVLPIMGTAFKKSYYSPELHRNCSELCLPDSVVVNMKAKDLKTARRVTHVIPYYRNDVITKQRSGLWLDDEDKVKLQLNPPTEDTQGPFEFLEQHRFLDLDEDGLEEPYIVTCLCESGAIVRIVARYDLQDIVFNTSNEVVHIEPEQYFTKYSFLPNFAGEFYDIGFGQFLLNINETIDTSLNQLLDAGSLANLQGGFISRQLRVKGGEIRFNPGEWKFIDSTSNDLRTAIMPLPFKEPSQVLFSLLQFLIEAGNRLSSVSEVLSGEQSGVNVPATTTLALIEQGLKVFSAINKRIYKSLKEELKLLAKLNYRYLNEKEYQTVLDIQGAIERNDYNMSDLDIVPVADPGSSSDTQRLIRAEALMKTIGVPGAAAPFNIMHEYYSALKVPNLDKFHQPQPPPPPDSKMIEVQGRIQLQAKKLPYEIRVLETQAMLNLAKAEQAGAGQEAEQMAAQVELAMNAQEHQQEMVQNQQQHEQDMQHQQAQQQMDQQAQQQKLAGQLMSQMVANNGEQNGANNAGGDSGVEATPTNPEGAGAIA